MGTNLCGLKKKVFIDVDGKLLKLKWGGKNRLTKSRINMLSSYYRNAIRKNPGDPASMYEAIWAVFHHSVSIDAVHDQSHCPTGPDTWFKFNKAISEGKTLSPLTPIIPEDLGEYVEPVFTALARTDLLEQCESEETRIKMKALITSSGLGALRLVSVL